MARKSKSRKARRNPLNGTFIVTHSNPGKRRRNAPSSGGSMFPPGAAAAAAAPMRLNSALRVTGKTQAKIARLQGEGRYHEADDVYRRSHRTLKGLIKKGAKRTNPLLTNPAYKVTITTSGDSAAVKKALKAAGFTDVKVKASVKGPKRKPGPYAIFVKSKMPALMASGVSAPEAMKKIGAMWRSRGAKSNPSKSRRRASRSSRWK